MKNCHDSVILRPKLPHICIYLKIRKFADSRFVKKPTLCLQRRRGFELGSKLDNLFE